MSTTHLKTVVLNPGPSMRRKGRGQEVAAIVHFCPSCNWESAPCRTMAETRRKPVHECRTVAIGPLFDQGEARGRVTCR